MDKKPIKIKTISQLKKYSKKNGGCDFFIILMGNMLRSSKHISYDGKKFHITNEIDGSNQTLTEKQLINSTNTLIGEAMQKGAFYKY